jgi:excinuclease ABC subunit C
MKRFGSLSRVRAAKPEQLAEVPGIGPELARTIHDHLTSPVPVDRKASA